MDEEEIKTSVSEERIHLFEAKIDEKEHHARRAFSFRLTIFLIVIFALCLSPFLPVFSCRNTEVKGAYLLDRKTLLSYASYHDSTPLIFINEKKLAEKISQKEFIASCEVSWHVFGLDITIDEIACVLKSQNEQTAEYILSNGETLNDFLTRYPDSTYDFQEEETPLLISDLSFLNQDQDATQSQKRKLQLLRNMKEIAPSILKQAAYFDIAYTKDGQTLLFGFYFPFGDGKYVRILMRDESFAYFLEERRLQQIFNAIENTSDKNLYKHDTINSLSYYNTVCMYDGKENACRLL